MRWCPPTLTRPHMSAVTTGRLMQVSVPGTPTPLPTKILRLGLVHDPSMKTMLHFLRLHVFSKSHPLFSADTPLHPSQPDKSATFLCCWRPQVALAGIAPLSPIPKVLVNSVHPQVLQSRCLGILVFPVTQSQPHATKHYWPYICPGGHGGLKSWFL